MPYGTAGVFFTGLFRTFYYNQHSLGRNSNFPRKQYFAIGNQHLEYLPFSQNHVQLPRQFINVMSISQ